MSNNNSSDTRAKKFSWAFDELCDDVMCALEAEHEYGDIDALIVLARALKKRSKSTSDELAAVLVKELDLEVDHDVIEAAIVLNKCLGSDWYVFLTAHNSRNDCFLASASVAHRIEAARKDWEGWFKDFDLKREKEKEAAMAWLNRQAKKAA
ncbi:MAG: hypothetical protein M3Q42_08330 [Pseudomonadota bacterium]|nr:hypothetical protein [Pseudomonadota bacterium]